MTATNSRLVIVAAALSATAYAQAPDPDFSGVYIAAIYVAVPDVTEPDVYPFTDAGRAAFAQFDPYSAVYQDDDCEIAPMPSLIFNGDPMEILADGDDLVFHYERSNIRRTIHMDGSAPSADEPHTVLGYSVGRWNGADELIIETTHLLAGAIRTSEGQPMSSEARAVERYRREPGERDLRVSLTVYDSVNYTAPVEFGRALVYSTEDEVKDWGCVDLGPKDAPPDIDELVRMLEQLE